MVAHALQNMLTRIILRIVIDAVIITVRTDSSVISAGQMGKNMPDQATHVVMRAQDHSKKKKSDLI